MNNTETRRSYRITGWIILGLLLIQSGGPGDNFQKELSEKLELYKKNNPMEMVYVHTDKDVYSPGDDLYFKAYVKDLYSPGLHNKSLTLTLFLMDARGNSVVANSNEIKNGTASGKLELDLSLPEGMYTLVGFTDLMRSGKPENVFTKKLFVSYLFFPHTIIHLSTPDTVYAPDEEAEISVYLLSPGGKPERRSFTWSIYLNGAVYLSSEGKTDRTGKAVVTARLPGFRENSIVSAEISVTRSGVPAKNQIILPVRGLPFYVNFFPESGKLVDGLESKVGFIARDCFGNRREIEGQIIDQDGNAVLQVKSLYRGLGSFTLIPDQTRPLRLKITRPAGVSGIFDLPGIATSGVVLTYEKNTNSPLSFRLAVKPEGLTGALHIIAEQDGRIRWYGNYPVSEQLRFQIPGADLQGGIARITVFDPAGNFLAQRALFLHERNSYIRAVTDRTEYIPNEEVKLDIEVLGRDGGTVLAEMSIAVTDANLDPDWNGDPDLFTYFTFGPSVDKSPFPPGYYNNPEGEIEREMDCLMLTLAEDKFRWNEILGTPGTVSQAEGSRDFMARVQEYFRSDQLNRVYAGIKKDQFFDRYILKYNQVFPEYYMVNRRHLSRTTPPRSGSEQVNRIQQELANGKPILDVIRSIKNFQLLDNKIVFYGPNSLNYQAGALIVFDGVKMGEDVRILSTLNPHDIKNIRVITNPTEVLMYTGLNPVGIIEITTKGNDMFGEGTVDKSQEYNPTLYWNPYVFNLEDKPLSITFTSTHIKSSYNIVVQGVDEKGNPVYAVKNFSVY